MKFAEGSEAGDSAAALETDPAAEQTGRAAREERARYRAGR